MENQVLHDYLFHFNVYEKTWYAFKRKDQTAFFNGTLEPSDYCKARKIDHIIEFLYAKKS